MTSSRRPTVTRCWSCQSWRSRNWTKSLALWTHSYPCMKVGENIRLTSGCPVSHSEPSWPCFYPQCTFFCLYFLSGHCATVTVGENFGACFCLSSDYLLPFRSAESPPRRQETWRLHRTCGTHPDRLGWYIFFVRMFSDGTFQLCYVANFIFKKCVSQLLCLKGIKWMFCRFLSAAQSTNMVT